ncbi:hypothetical protein [Cellulosilyticum sp. I15G10I2]|uniref:hypothetical protein n=1 Tax=Cellulosilyticum sp. I15G10I2 TaxID=1892843 RepID=UPI00085C7E68|nr:hypothetical protein [Cellulosilyticum sp. I15G10I2]
MTFKFATIKANSKVLFDGEDTEVELNRYFRNALYSPITGDRVLFLYDEISKVYILQGKVVK